MGSAEPQGKAPSRARTATEPEPFFRRLADLAARDYGIGVVVPDEGVLVEGVLRGLWRDDFGNGVPGRSVLVELPGGVEERVIGPLPVSARIRIVSDNRGTLAAASPAQAVRAKFVLAPATSSIRLRFVGGERDGRSEVIAIGEMRSRLWFPLERADAGVDVGTRSEFVCAGSFVADGPRRVATDMVFCGYVTLDETEPAVRPAIGAGQTTLDHYRVQFMDGPLVAVVDHVERTANGRPAGMLRLTATVAGNPVVASYRYANIAARSAVGVRCSYAYVAGSSPSWRA